ncbi:winged helix-turn-helix transcriptional regulator [Candidatus Woesearchaeota archaeon]|nr:winged helix-turn-helix transcriptional regulator [Candidatus Woesearchaeota archaeon]
MKKIEFVYREILFNVIEKNNKKLTQAYLANTLKISLSTVNLALKPLVKMNSVKINKNDFDVIDSKKILYYWASIRNVDKDIIYKTRVEEPVREIEKQMPDDVVFAAYSGYKFKFKDVPADYSEVYVYGTENIKNRFKENDKNPNLFVLEKDSAMEKYGKTITTANLFVDLWNLKQWYAKDFLKAVGGKIGRILE